MKRDLSIKLKNWANQTNHKPIILRGPRQVGKSWLVEELGREFDNFVEINFEMLPEMGTFFEGNLDPFEIIKNISNYLNVNIIESKTLLFFDEIQQVPRAITSLRYFYEKIPKLHIIAAGSLLEFELSKISIPVGRISFMYVYPLSFSEFLTATANEKLREMLKTNEFNELSKPFHEKLLNEVRNYTIIGGMPEVVEKYIFNSSNLNECMDIQSDILETYRSDFQKYAKKNEIKYLSKVFDSIPHQIGQKFKYNAVDKNIKSTFLREALDLLEMAGIVYKVYHSNSNGIPLGAETNLSKFKILFFDIGLAQRLLKLDYSKSLLDNNISQINKGTIAELFVGLELISYSNKREKANLYYWHREAKSSNAEIDYVTVQNEIITPIEVKSSSTGAMKSIKIFMDSKKVSLGFKISSFPYSFTNNIQSIPFYGLKAFVEDKMKK